jgi:glycosyltransferase involved in cell wall biosynthesis
VRLNIVAVNWRDMRDPDAGGAEIHLHEILRRMVERGHRVTWFSCRFQGGAPSDSVDGIDIIRRGNWYDANYVIPRAVRAWLKSNSADLVVEDINKIPFYLPLYTRLPVMPVIPHLFGATVFRETNPLFALYVYAWERLIPRVYRNCRFTVISSSTRDDLIRRGIPEENVDVVLCGLDHDRFRLIGGLERYEVPTIVHFGRVRKYKAIDVVMRAFARIRATLPDARLIVIGDGPELGNLKKLAVRMDLGGSIEFTGRVETDRMVEILNRCHLFMNASPKEGWGLTVVEANACGVPVVGSNRPGLKDSILDNKTGFLAEYGDSDGFAERGLRLLTDADLWNRFSEAGLEWARSLTWDRTANEMEELFLRDAVGPKGGERPL